MENLFSPCTRYRDILESQGHFPQAVGLQELNLDVSTEEFLSAERAFTYAALYALLADQNTVAWLTPDAAVVRKQGKSSYCGSFLQEDYRFSFSVDEREMFAMARSSEALSEIVDAVRRLLMADARDMYHLTLSNVGIEETEFFDAHSLAYLLDQCQKLRGLTLEHLVSLDEDHVRVLGAISRPDLEIQLVSCTLTSTGKSALAEILERNQGPTRLDGGDIDHSVLAEGLRGNSRLRILIARISGYLEAATQEYLVIADAIRENKGFEQLVLTCVRDEAWDAVCNSLKTHPTLEILGIHLRLTIPLAPAVLKSRMQALVDMLKVNTSIWSLYLIPLIPSMSCSEGQSFLVSRRMNRLRPRLLAIQKTRPFAYRAKVLGRALLAVRTDVNGFWVLLAGNAEVAFPSAMGHRHCASYQRIVGQTKGVITTIASHRDGGESIVVDCYILYMVFIRVPMQLMVPLLLLVSLLLHYCLSEAHGTSL